MHHATAGVRNGDLSIECTALHRVHFHHRASRPSGGQIFPGLSRLCGSKPLSLYAVLQKVPHRKTPGCISAKTFAVFTPQQTTVFRGKATTSSEICFIKISCCGSHISAPDGRARHLRRRDRTYRSLTVAVEQRAKFSNIIRQVFRRTQVSSANGIGLAAPLALPSSQRLFCASHRYVQHPPARGTLPADHSCLLAGNQLIKPHTEALTRSSISASSSPANSTMFSQASLYQAHR